MRIITTIVADFVVFANRVRIATAGIVVVDNTHSLSSRYLCAAAPAASAAKAKPAGNHPGESGGEEHRLAERFSLGQGGQWLGSHLPCLLSWQPLPQVRRRSMPDFRSMSLRSIPAA